MTAQPSIDGFAPLRPFEVAGRAIRYTDAPSNDDLSRFVRGYGPQSVGTFRCIAAELLDWREGKLRAPPLDETEAAGEYVEALEFMLAR